MSKIERLGSESRIKSLGSILTLLVTIIMAVTLLAMLLIAL